MPSLQADIEARASGMRNWMADEGARLVDSGYPVIPIAAGAKFPGRWSGSRGWTALSEWQRHCNRPTKPFELDIWRRWPGCGVGIAGGLIVGVDIDILEAGIADEVEGLARDRLGDTPGMRIGRAPKKLLVYRAAKPFPKMARHPVEVIAHGAQFVAYGQHPETLQPYRWPIDELAELPLSALPVVTEGQCVEFLDTALRIVPPDMRRSTLGPDRSAEHYHAAGGELRGTIAAVKAAMAHIPNDDLHYDDWIRIGLALKGALGPAGFDLWAEWSARSPKDVPRNTVKAWNGLKPDRIGAGTIYYYASERGWVPDHDMILNGAVAEAVDAVPEPAHLLIEPKPGLAPVPILPRIAPSTGEANRLAVEAPGLLGQLVDWMSATAVSPQPFLALGAALCGLGAIMGRRYRLEGPDTRSALYVIALADSGGGKDHPRACMRRLLVEAGLGSYLGGETIASGSGLLASVAAHPARLFQVDEFGHFVSAVLDPRSHAHHRREIMTNLTSLWTSTAGVMIGTEYANQKDRPRIDIQQPCVCVYGSTVPQTFWRAMQSGNVADGSLARFLIFQSPVNYPDEQEPEPVENRLPVMLDGVRAVVAQTTGLGGVMAPNIAPIPLTIELDAAAMAADVALRERHLGIKREHEGTPFSAIVARHREHVRRLALVAAVATDPARPIVTGLVYGWAERLVDHCLATVLDQATRFIADSEHEAMGKRVLEIIRRHGDWMDGSTLARKTQFLSRKMRAEFVADLIEGGFLNVRYEKTGTKPRTLVRASDEVS